MASLLNYFIFSKQKVIQDKLIEPHTPLDFNELPDSLLYLKAMEAAVIDILISFHYRLDDLKLRMVLEFKNGTTKRATDLWTERVNLCNKKKLFERHLEKIQMKMKELR